LGIGVRDGKVHTKSDHFEDEIEIGMTIYFRSGPSQKGCGCQIISLYEFPGEKKKKVLIDLSGFPRPNIISEEFLV